MDNQASNVAFYKSRTVLGRLSASFKFMNDNLGTILKLGIYCLLPLAVVQGIYFALYGTDVTVFQTFDVVNVLLLIIMTVVSIASVLLFSSLLYTLVQKYAEHGALPAYRFKDLKKDLLVNAKKIFFLGLLLFVLVAIYVGLSISLLCLSFGFFVVSVFLFFVLALPFSFFGYIYILEDISLLDAFKKAFVMGMRTWGSTFAVLFITGFLAGIIQVIAYLPWGIGLMVGQLATGSTLLGGDSTLPGFFPYLMFVLGAIAVLVSTLAQMMPVLSMGFQYASVETARRERLQSEKETQSL